MINEDENTIIASTPPAPMTPGQQLRQAREAANLTQEAVAKKLFINKQFIIDIEDDNYDKLTAPVYARGYLSVYARLLQLPVEPILEAFDKLTQSAKDSSLSMNILQEIEISPTNKEHQYRWLGYMAAIVVVIALMLWGYTHFQQINAEQIIEKPVAVTPAQTPTNNIEPTIPETPMSNDKTNTTVISMPPVSSTQYTEEEKP